MTATDLAKRMVQLLEEDGRISVGVEAPVEWFPKPTQADPNALDSGEAQAVLSVEGRRFCISVEPLD